MLAPAPLRCPISLDAPPLCAQITPCGHVFAFPSIMAHLAAHNDRGTGRRAAPCPLCYAPLVARELRLVRVHQAAAPQARPCAAPRVRRARCPAAPPGPACSQVLLSHGLGAVPPRSPVRWAAWAGEGRWLSGSGVWQ
jgi:hypothetical protein